MKEYKFMDSNGNRLIIKADNLDAAFIGLIKITKHPSDFNYQS